MLVTCNKQNIHTQTSMKTNRVLHFPIEFQMFLQMTQMNCNSHSSQPSLSSTSCCYLLLYKTSLVDVSLLLCVSKIIKIRRRGFLIIKCILKVESTSVSPNTCDTSYCNNVNDKSRAHVKNLVSHLSTVNLNCCSMFDWNPTSSSRTFSRGSLLCYCSLYSYKILYVEWWWSLLKLVFKYCYKCVDFKTTATFLFNCWILFSIILSKTKTTWDILNIL